MTLPMTTPKQMALSLYEDLFSLGMTISESPQDIGFQRNNVVVEITNIGAGAYRALDAFIFVVNNEPNIQARYDVDLSYFRWLMRYDSGNYKHFRAMLRELQQAALQLAQDPEDSNPLTDNYASVPMLGPFAITGGRLIFEMPALMQRHLKAPEQAHWLSLRSAAQLTLLYAKVIYNRVLPYVDDGETEWYTVDTVKGWPGDANTPAVEYKYFRRDYLIEALEQINSKSNINIQLDTKPAPKSRKIAFIRFLLSWKEIAVVENPVNSLKGADQLYHTLRDEIGLSPKNFEEIEANRGQWTDTWIQNALDFTRWKLEKGEVKKGVSGFFMYALRNNLKVASAERVLQEQQEKLEKARAAKEQVIANTEVRKEADKAAAVKAHQQQLESQMLAGISAFDDLAPDARTAMIKAFAKTLPAKIAARKDVDLKTLTEAQLRASEPLARAFGQYMYEQAKKQS